MSDSNASESGIGLKILEASRAGISPDGERPNKAPCSPAASASSGGTTAANAPSAAKALGAATLPEQLQPYIGVTLADVLIVHTPEDLAVAGEALLAADVLGFDTESRPTFRKGEVSTGPHLIQLSTDQRVFLFQVGRGEAPELLHRVLAAPNILKVGFGLRDDLKRLRLKYAIHTAHVLDLAVALREVKRIDIGAKSAVAQYFGQRLQKSKKTSTTNWSNPKLTDAQILYAANDAQVALRVYREWRSRSGVQSAHQTPRQTIT